MSKGRSADVGRTADVAVIGGGIVGANAAAILAEAGLHVRLYERATIAAGASGRNSGVVQHPQDRVLAGLYRESLEMYRALELVAGRPDRGFEMPARPAGLLHVGRDRTAIERIAAGWRSAFPEIAAAVLEENELQRLEPSLAPDLVACRVEIGYPVAPATATEAFAALATRRGVDLRLGARARVVMNGGRAVGVAVDGRRETAGAVVAAAGPWTPELIDPSHTWRPIRSVYGVVAQVGLAKPPRHVLEEAEIRIEPGQVSDEDDPAADDGLAFSLVTAAGATSLGSTFLEAEPDPAAYATPLRRRGATFVPALGDAPLLGLRACARPVTSDGRPLVGRIAGAAGLFVAAGHGPWGISTGPATARMVADLILGREPAIPTELDPARFGRVPTGPAPRSA